MFMRRELVIASGLLVAACVTGNREIIPAMRPAELQNSITVDRPRAEVWAKGIPQLGQRFFVINNLDQASGFVNVSYSGDPEKYVDGGTARFTVQNARGPRTYEFPVASAHQVYEAA